MNDRPAFDPSQKLDAGRRADREHALRPFREGTTAETRCTCASDGNASRCPFHTQADFDAAERGRRPTHHEHGVGHGDYADVECCICPGTPCGAVTVADMLAHVVYDRAQAERQGEFRARQQISDAIARSAPPDNPLEAQSQLLAAIEDAYRNCWTIARGDIDNPPF